jgi:C-terminal processing protease CtpA/Prc
MLADATGYIKVAEFTPRAAEEVKSEIDALRRAGAHALVLDRAARGGSAGGRREDRGAVPEGRAGGQADGHA